MKFVSLRGHEAIPTTKPTYNTSVYDNEGDALDPYAINPEDRSDLGYVYRGHRNGAAIAPTRFTTLQKIARNILRTT